MDGEPPKGPKWPAEGLHYTLSLTSSSAKHPGSSGGRLNSNLPGSVWLLSVELARHWLSFLAAAVLGLTQPRKV